MGGTPGGPPGTRQGALRECDPGAGALGMWGWAKPSAHTPGITD